ncbi:hypothetical protein ABK040_008457 [Willaertia magna]
MNSSGVEGKEEKTALGYKTSEDEGTMFLDTDNDHTSVNNRKDVVEEEGFTLDAKDSLSEYIDQTTNEQVIHSEKHVKTRKPIWKVLCFALYYIGMASNSAFVLGILLPTVIIQMLGDENKELYLSIVVAVGTALSLFIGPLFGHISDKYFIRYPFFFGAIILWSTCVALQGLIAHLSLSFPFYTIPFFVTFAIIICFSKNFYVITTAIISALIADLFPKEQMNIVSAIVGIFSLIGVVIGVVISGFIMKYIDILWICVGFATLSLTLSLPVLVFFKDIQELRLQKLTNNEQPIIANAGTVEPIEEAIETIEEGVEINGEDTTHILHRSPILETTTRIEQQSASKIQNVKNFITAFISPFQNRNFFWVFLTRFMVWLTNVAARSYFLYFIRDVLKPYNFLFSDKFPSTDEQALSLLLGFVFIFTLLGAGLAQPITRFIGKRKVFCIACTILCISNVLNAIFRTYNALIVCASFQGLGIGFFMSVDLALVNAVLPNPDESAKDMALWNISSYIPDLLGVPVGGLLIFIGNKIIPHTMLRGFGYILLFSVAAGLQILSGLLIFMVKLPSDVDRGIKKKISTKKTDKN